MAGMQGVHHKLHLIKHTPPLAMKDCSTLQRLWDSNLVLVHFAPMCYTAPLPNRTSTIHNFVSVSPIIYTICKLLCICS